MADHDPRGSMIGLPWPVGCGSAQARTGIVPSAAGGAMAPIGLEVVSRPAVKSWGARRGANSLADLGGSCSLTAGSHPAAEKPSLDGSPSYAVLAALDEA